MRRRDIHEQESEGATTCQWVTYSQIPNNGALSSLIQSPHLIVVDVPAVVHRSEALADAVFDATILPLTVYTQVRQRSAAAYRKAHDNVFMRECAWFLFDDEHHPDVYVPKEEHGAAAAARDAQLLHRTVKWYERHVKLLGFDEVTVGD